MSNAKHTPGPWEACIQDADTGEKWFDIWSASHGSIAHVSEFARPDENLRSFRADARLIAAAPEMLEALEKAYLELVTFLNYGNFNGANFTTANASCVDGHVEWDAGYIVDVIAKATGGANG